MAEKAVVCLAGTSPPGPGCAAKVEEAGDGAAAGSERRPVRTRAAKGGRDVVIQWQRSVARQNRRGKAARGIYPGRDRFHESCSPPWRLTIIL